MKTSKLKDLIKEKDYTMQEFANAVGMGRTTLYYKLEKQSDFTRKEMQIIIDLLDIKDSDIRTYFFNSSVRESAKRQV